MKSKTLTLLCILALGFVTLGAQARADDAMSGMEMGGPKAQKPTAAHLSVTATVNPAAPKTGDNALDLMIADASGNPVTGLKLTTSVAMTSMDMGTTHPAFTDKGNGHYVATIAFAMDGPWRVVVRNQGSKLAVLDFASGSKSAWKAPEIKATAGTPNAPLAPAAKPAPTDGKRDAMAGMDMSGGAATAPGTDASPSASTQPTTSAKSESAPAAGGMTGMDMSSTADAGMGTMKMGIADMKTAQIPELQEKGTYTATGAEDWKTQTGFGHNAGMVGMMNQMMVGGSGMEGMKMPAMTMKFDAQNYAKSDEGDSADTMPGMDMSGKSKPGEMPGMKMDAAASSVKPDAPTDDSNAMPGMAAPQADKSSSTASTPVTMAATVSAPKAGDNALTIRITDAEGKPVPGAKIAESVAMTSMDMGTSHPAVTDAGNGTYKSTVTFSMAGPWRITMKVTAPGQKTQTKSFDFTAK